MMTQKSWKTGLALALTLGMSSVPVLPLLTQASATAQVFSSPRRASNRTFRIVRGTVLPAEYDDGETTKIVVTPDESLDLTLRTSRAVRSTRGTEIIPAGTEIIGQIEPYRDGVRFVAQTLLLEDGTEQEIEATSRVFADRQEVDGRRNNDSVWQGALVGGAAATIISAAVTDVGIFKTLAGAGAGALTGWLLGRDRTRSKEVIVIDPQRDLNLVVNEEFLLSRRYASR